MTWLVKGVVVWNRLFVSFDAHRLQVKFHNGQAAAEQDLNNGKIQKNYHGVQLDLGALMLKNGPYFLQKFKTKGLSFPCSCFIFNARSHSHSCTG